MNEVLGHEQGKEDQKGGPLEGVKEERSKTGYPESNVENHHNIPRQYYGDWGGSSSDGDNSGANGSG